MEQQGVIPASGGVGIRLMKGELLHVIDPQGGQSGDLFALSADGAERLSNGRTFDYQGKIYLTTGDILWSDRSRPMFSIVADEVGRHDFLYASCTSEMYQLQYGQEDHPNCADNLSQALRGLGLDPGPPPTAFNVFMCANVAPDGSLSFQPPPSQAGSAIIFRAEMDLAVALSSCPASLCNGGQPPRPLAYQIVPVK